jgi:4-alpha-glucanotransferase
MTASTFSERASGILLHPTSLPGRFGIGDIGPSAHRFAEFLARAGQRYWQMLPVAPPGGGDSPYDSPSAFAGSPLLVSLELLKRDGLLDSSDLSAPRRLAEAEKAMFLAGRRYRMKRLQKAFARFRDRPEAGLELERYAEAEGAWVRDYALFGALKRANRGAPWTRWATPLARREPHALETARKELAVEVEFELFVQYEFSRQWRELRERCTALGVRLLGDIPMFVAHDASDVWANQRCFQLKADGERRMVAGVPPDYFSEEGQLWGNPLYDWQALRESGYDWWISRLRSMLERFDAVRLDHFIGFHRFWQVPAESKSARDGHFAEAPGEDFFEHAKAALGALPFIAEDLGIMTEGVVRLRDRFELPGMRILGFGFAGDWREYQPHRYPRNAVVYTGTHDNDTVVGWLSAAQRESVPERKRALAAESARALAYAASDGREPHWDMIRLALSSVANTAIFPVQDLLGQGNEHRMNVPGTASGNWRYRVPEAALTPAIADRLAELCELYERIPPGLRRGT